MSEIDWSKAPEGYPIWMEYLSEALEADAARRLNGGEWVVDKGDRYETTRGTFWSKPSEGYYKTHECPAPWNGEGLPPVGTICEVENDVLGGWVRVDKVLAHSAVGGSEVAVFQRVDMISYALAGSFRPIRTPEQIAAEEREKAVAEMTEVLRNQLGTSYRDDLARLYCFILHDAGYQQ